MIPCELAWLADIDAQLARCKTGIDWIDARRASAIMRDQHVQLELAKERMGPAGFRILKEVVDLRIALRDLREHVVHLEKERSRHVRK